MNFNRIPPMLKAYIAHCDRMHTLHVRPLRWCMFKNMVEEIMCDDMMASIRDFQPEY